MAITGLMGFGFVIMHMLGNLQIYLGQNVEGIYALDQYAKNLRAFGPMLYVARFGLLTIVLLHIVAAFQLTKISHQGRPVKYYKTVATGSDYASRTMRVSGPIVLLFIIYHLLDFTFGNVNPNFHEGQVYANVLASFSNPLISLFYIVAMLSLGLHMYHGLWSLFQSLGANNTKYNDLIRKFALLATLVVVIGNISIPISVLIGVIKK
ncbi:MAG: succinate dehydrogenase cytochrome b subunit [Acidobacteria bacterium]|nr:succinate dehydrogenase cytochrome b subunit [Acidobacteriota bacterium]